MHRIALTVICCLFLVGCTINEKQEIQMGRESHVKFEQQFGGLYQDQRVQQYVNAVGLGWSVKTQDAAEFPAYSGSVDFQYASPLK